MADLLCLLDVTCYNIDPLAGPDDKVIVLDSAQDAGVPDHNWYSSSLIGTYQNLEGCAAFLRNLPERMDWSCLSHYVCIFLSRTMCMTMKILGLDFSNAGCSAAALEKVEDIAIFEPSTRMSCPLFSLPGHKEPSAQAWRTIM